jgi:hypothetical protein
MDSHERNLYAEVKEKGRQRLADIYRQIGV